MAMEAAEVLASFSLKVANETSVMEELDTGDVQIVLSSKENPISVQSIGQSTCQSLLKKILLALQLLLLE